MRENNSKFWNVLGMAIVLTLIVVVYYTFFVDKEMTPNNQSTTTETAVQGMLTYPEKLPTTYISTVEWPPKIATSTESYSCSSTTTATSSGIIAEQKTIGGRMYCITKESDAAAGSTYTNYVYAWEQGNELIRMKFILRAVQCMNYDNPKQTECLNERSSFDVDAFADGIAKTLK